MTQTVASRKTQAKNMLHELGVPVHLIGYKELCIAIPLFAQNNLQCVTKELYPDVARSIGYPGRHGIERSIRKAISDAWNKRDAAIWEKYFPNLNNAPSNKLFIATLAERLV